MASMAKVQIIGNVGRDSEPRYALTGTKTVSFSVAVNNRRRNPDGSFQEETEWFRVTTFGRLAEICEQYVSKGRTVYVDGRLRLDRWTGQDGQPRVTPDVVASDVQFLGARVPPEEAGAPPPEQASAPARPAPATRPSEPSDLEDLPF